MIFYLRQYGTLTGLALMVLVFTILLPETFLAPRNLLNVAQQMSILAVVAFTMTIVMTMGDFDLSVGSIASLAGIIAALTFQATGSVPLGMAAALVAGLICGALNGVLISYVGILPFVATLGTLTIFSGTAFLISGGKTIFGAAIPEAFANLAKGGIPLWQSGDQILRLPNLVILAAIVLFAIWFALHKMVFGRIFTPLAAIAKRRILQALMSKRCALPPLRSSALVPPSPGLCSPAAWHPQTPFKAQG